MSSNPCIFPDGKYGDALEAVFREVQRAKAKHTTDFHSHHEGFAILKEEVDELWDDVKANNHENAIIEAVQVAAMAIRYIAELGEYPYTKGPVVDLYPPNFTLIKQTA